MGSKAISTDLSQLIKNPENLPYVIIKEITALRKCVVSPKKEEYHPHTMLSYPPHRSLNTHYL